MCVRGELVVQVVYFRGQLVVLFRKRAVIEISGQPVIKSGGDCDPNWGLGDLGSEHQGTTIPLIRSCSTC